MKIKTHIPTESYGFVEAEFNDYDEYIKEYTNLYVKVKTLHEEAANCLTLQRTLNNKQQ